MSLTYVNVLKEIYDRITARVTTGGSLESLVGVFYDPPVSERQPGDLPVVFIYDQMIDQESPMSQNRMKDLFTVVVELHHELPETGTFDYANQSGPLVILERLLNAIETTTSGSVDIVLAPYCIAIKNRRTLKTYKDSCIVYKTVITYQMKEYIAGGR